MLCGAGGRWRQSVTGLFRFFFLGGLKAFLVTVPLQFPYRCLCVNFTHATNMSYRKVSNGQDVDESLFGKPSGRRPRHNEGRRGGPSAPSTAMSRSALANLGASIAVGNIKDGLVVSRSDLNNFKDMTVIKTHDMVLKQRAARNKAREDRMKEAQKRKKRMRELEAEGKKHTVKSERK